MSERVVIHVRRMRNGTGWTEASVTAGPVAQAADEIIRDLVERCGHAVRNRRTTRTFDGIVVRREFEVDVALDGETYIWDHIVTDPADPYKRMTEATS